MGLASPGEAEGAEPGKAAPLRKMPLINVLSCLQVSVLMPWIFWAVFQSFSPMSHPRLVEGASACPLSGAAEELHCGLLPHQTLAALKWRWLYEKRLFLPQR